MGDGAGEERAEAERGQYAQEKNNVSRRSEEDCRRAKSEMGEDQSCAKKDSVRIPRRQNWENSRQLLEEANARKSPTALNETNWASVLH